MWGLKYRVLFLVIVVLAIIADGVLAAYRPELSGDLEIGSKYYSEILLDDFPLDVEEDYISSEDFIDFYSYKKLWLKYKQQLTRDNYYYLKGQYYEKIYEDQLKYNNNSIDLWGDYTFKLSDRLRNKWTVNLRDKNYYNNLQNSYNLLRIRCQFDFQYSEIQDYTIYYQRQWKDYIYSPEKDNISDKLSLSLDYKLNDNCTLNSGIQLDRELFGEDSASSNKYGKRFNIGFKVKL